jgi:hypothetical protein
MLLVSSDSHCNAVDLLLLAQMTACASTFAGTYPEPFPSSTCSTRMSECNVAQRHTVQGVVSMNVQDYDGSGDSSPVLGVTSQARTLHLLHLFRQTTGHKAM